MKTPENRRRYARNYYHAHKREIRKWERERYATDAVYRQYKLDVAKRRERRLKLEMVAAYGSKCGCCSEKRTEFLTLDHIFGDGAAERRSLKRDGGGGRFYARLKRLGWPQDRYRLLCMNCNFSFGIFGYCPHKKEER